MGQTEGIPDGWVWKLWLLAVGGIWGIWLSAVGWVGEHLADCAWVQGESDSVTWVGLGGVWPRAMTRFGAHRQQGWGRKQQNSLRPPPRFGVKHRPW